MEVLPNKLNYLLFSGHKFGNKLLIIANPLPEIIPYKKKKQLFFFLFFKNLFGNFMEMFHFRIFF